MRDASFAREATSFAYFAKSVIVRNQSVVKIGRLTGKMLRNLEKCLAIRRASMAAETDTLKYL
jgi:hypothetical protein